MLVVAAVVVVIATVVSLRIAFNQPKSSVSIAAVSESPFAIRSKPPTYKDIAAQAWFEHDLTVENTSDRPIAIPYDDSISGTYLGDHQLLVMDDECGPGSPMPGKQFPSFGCTSIGHNAIQLAPHTSAKLTTIAGYSQLAGMPALDHGDYVWDKDITWRFADATELQKAHVKITYSVK